MRPPPQPDRPQERIALDIPFTTVFKVAAAIGVLAALWLLRPFIAVFLLALLAAVTLSPLLGLFERRGRLSRGMAVLTIALLLVGTMVGFWALILPALTSQVSSFVGHAKELQAQAVQRPTNDLGQRALREAIAWPHSEEAKELFRHKWTWGMALLDTLTGVVLLLILTLYLLLDGRRLYAWMLSYVPRSHRDRVAATVPEVSRVVRAYVRGQAITSVICAVYAWGALTLLHVPGALPLAIIAGIFDILPVLGFILAVVPAALLALTRSPATALLVIGLYVLYHALENYLLAPKIYGKQLRLSTLTVLLAIIVGGTIGGVLGAILVLPVVAAYPIFERMWLGGYVGHEAIEDHAALDHPHDEVAENAAEKIIEGQRPPGSENPTAPRH